MRDKRLLICGPVIPGELVGGLQQALRDLGEALATRGWRVDLAITPESLGLPSGPQRVRQVEGLAGSRWSILPRFRFLPADLRTLLQHVLLDGGVAQLQSDLLHALEARLRPVRHHAVIACVSREAPGLAHFVTARHPNVLLLSLNGLASELRLAPWLRLPRLAGRCLSRRRLHADLYTPVATDRIRSAVFASEAWREETVRAGLPRAVAKTIYFGVPDAGPLEAERTVNGKLLWVGRLSPEKGLLQFIDAVAALRRTRAITLTAICGQGPSDYFRAVKRRIRARGLQDVVSLQPAVSRGQLRPLYRQHDVLLFQSVFREPVALVMLEAFAAGLPVVAPQPPDPGALLHADRTAVCYRSSSSVDIAAAIERALDDRALRARVRAGAHELARAEFSLETMAQAYDAALDRLLQQSHVTAA